MNACISMRLPSPSSTTSRSIDETTSFDPVVPHQWPLHSFHPSRRSSGSHHEMELAMVLVRRAPMGRFGVRQVVGLGHDLGDDRARPRWTLSRPQGKISPARDTVAAILKHWLSLRVLVLVDVGSTRAVTGTTWPAIGVSTTLARLLLTGILVVNLAN